jgi:hypothetical protein
MLVEIVFGEGGDMSCQGSAGAWSGSVIQSSGPPQRAVPLPWRP